MQQTLISKSFFSLKSIEPIESGERGTLTYVTSKEVPGLINISFVNVELEKKSFLGPIWYPNAHKIGYCLEGKVLVAIHTPERMERFTVEKGEMFFIPKGFIFHIQNILDQKSVLACSLSNTDPEVMFLSEALYSLSDTVFNSTFSTSSGFVEGLKNTENKNLLHTLSQNNNVADTTSQFKFNIEKSKKAILTTGGYLQVGTKKNFPVLDELGVLGFGLNPKGAVEPHWHTNAGELIYIVGGNTRITILAPDGTVDILEVGAGEGAFAPASHFHNIENVGSEPVEVIAFFTHAEPDYIGVGEVIGAYSNELLASIFNVSPSYFDALKKPEKPLVIVPI